MDRSDHGRFTNPQRKRAASEPTPRSLRKTSLLAPVHLPPHPPSRDHHPLRVFLCGAHSTGKTTLFQSILKDEFITGKNGICVDGRDVLYGQTEVARPVIRHMGLTRDHFADFRIHARVFEFVQHEISREQSRVEAENDRKRRNVLYDRGIDPVVYAWMYLGEEAKSRLLAESFLQDSIKRYRESVVFVMAPEKCCIFDDGFRMSPSVSDLLEYTRYMKLLLEELGIRYLLIEATELHSRTRFVLDTIKPLIIGQAKYKA